MRTHLTMRQSVDITTLLYLCVVLCNMNVEHCTTAELTCPDISYVQDSALMHCSMSVPYEILQYSGPGNVSAPQCVAGNKYCTPVKGYNASVVNATYSRLRILSIQPYHAGRWTCKNIPDGPSTSCNLVTTKTPTCSITSKEDTDVLAQDQTLTLTVDIQDYYCSTALTFSLQTGNVTTLLMEADSVSSVTHSTSSVALNVTDSHLGAVGLIFSCHHKQTSLTCDGVTELKTTDAPGNDEPRTPSTLMIIVAVVCAIVFLVIIIIIIVCVVKRKQVNDTKPQSPVNLDCPPYITVGQL
ncbi:uncharacterized protein LOC124150143 [Haliotis rufescens]|uniref:uncharacterized protein LOC124150143 n=1 Tax=Haliotis rufescens TaxID=6454 RepID=UPI00201F6696|nr:uncharacterized protein LOC124150143 [Haliotis rufescens]